MSARPAEAAVTTGSAKEATTTAAPAQRVSLVALTFDAAAVAGCRCGSVKKQKPVEDRGSGGESESDEEGEESEN
jgi:hypothetical protein